MDDKVKVNKLLTKLSKIFWMPQNFVASNLDDNFGSINLMWVLVGRPDQLQERHFTGANFDTWVKVRTLCKHQIDGIRIEDYATLYNPYEFYQLMLKHPRTVAGYFPTDKFYAAMKEAADDVIRLG